MGSVPDFDVVLAGGGLASGLLAYRLATQSPDLRIGIFETNDTLGGNHTWSFHSTDISAPSAAWLAPFVSYKWPSQQVRFPKRERHLTTGYQSIASERFHDVIAQVPNIILHNNVSVHATHADHLTTSMGPVTASVAFDGRGPSNTSALQLGFQKFLGMEVQTDAPHEIDAPIIMDATVPQTDGYRFVYVLPLSPDTLLIEDTYYADGHDLPKDVLREEITQYADRHGWTIARTIREEDGILPIVLDGNIDQFWQELSGSAVPIGLRAGLFHPVTGYSLGNTVDLIERLATLPLDPEVMAFAVEEYAKKQWRRHGFYRMLNRMLFRAAKPEARYIVLERFYGLPQPLIERFYAGQNSMADRVRVLAGKPPVPIGSALKALPATRKGQEIDEGVLG